MRAEISKTIPDRWDGNLEGASVEANICQSGYWARIVTRLEKATPFFIEVETKKGKFAAQALVLKRYPFDREKQKKRFFLPYFECFDGPILFDHQKARQTLQLILSKVISIARRSLATHITVTFPHTSRYAKDDDIADIFRKYNFSVNSWATYLVDLKKDEEELFRQLKHAARKCVKKCQREGLRVVEVKNYREFEQRYWLPYVQAEEYFGRKANPSNPATWDEDKEGRYHYYIVEDEHSRTLAALGMYIFNGVATEIASGTMPQAYEMKVPAQDLLHWEMILEAKRLGAHTFDLAGVSPQPRNSKEEGIRRFKEKWGGRYIEYYTYHRSIIPFLGRLVNV